jgi:hypothetical protein
MTRRAGKEGEVPFVIKEAGKAVERDVKPTINLLGKLLFENWPRPEPPPPPPAPRAQNGPAIPSKPKAVRLPASQGLVIRQVREPGHGPPPSADPPVILDAEIIEERPGAPNNSPICETCGGAGRLGRPGHEVPCPVCNPAR